MSRDKMTPARLLHWGARGHGFLRFAAVLVALALLALPTRAADFCVGSVPALQAALTTAAGNGEADTIQLQFGTYEGANLSYSSSEPFATHLRGGFAPGCTFEIESRDITVLRGAPDSIFLTWAATTVPTEFSRFTVQNAALKFSVQSNVVLTDVLFTSDDSDGDGVPDHADAFPADPAESADSDGDGVGDNADVFPNNAGESQDSDGDGIGDNSDPYINAVTRQVAIGSAVGVSVEVAPADAASVVMLDAAVTLDASAACPEVEGTVWPHMLTFEITRASAGESFPVSVDFGEALDPAMVPYKLLADGHCTPIEGATVAGSVVSYTLTDNGPYDANPADGELYDPLVLVMPIEASAESATVPLPIWALCLLGMLIGVGIALRRGRLH